jgi:para-nitrobenzyl esterase
VDQDIVVETPFGAVRGTRHQGIASFRRLPYSRPRTGSERFGRPTEPPTWAGIRDATARGPVPPQLPSRLDAVMGTHPMTLDEDCLHVDVWSPDVADATAPVLVFIHGGAFMTGGGSLPCYDGETLARNTGLVVVTVSYRLGILGFMPIPEFDAVNLGLHDQIAALRWVRQAIGAFGGDPRNVTVAGQSAGSHSIAIMLGLPHGRDLFDRAILMSAPLGLTLQRAQDVTGPRTALLGQLGRSPSDLEALRSASVEALLNAQRAMQGAAQVAGRVGDVTPPFLPVLDGELVTRDPLDAIRDGTGAWCPSIIGMTREEQSAFTVGLPMLFNLTEEQLRQAFVQQFGDDADAALAAARARRVPGRPHAILGDLKSDLLFKAPSLAYAEAQSAHGHASTYFYQFDWQSPMPHMDAGHCLDLPFLFGNLDVWSEAPMIKGADEDEVRGLVGIFQGSLAAFVRSGNPNGAGHPVWPAFVDGRAVLHFDRQIRAYGWRA